MATQKLDEVFKRFSPEVLRQTINETDLIVTKCLSSPVAIDDIVKGHLKDVLLQAISKIEIAEESEVREKKEEKDDTLVFLGKGPWISRLMLVLALAIFLLLGKVTNLSLPSALENSARHGKKECSKLKLQKASKQNRNAKRSVKC